MEDPCLLKINKWERRKAVKKVILGFPNEARGGSPKRAVVDDIVDDDGEDDQRAAGSELENSATVSDVSSSSNYQLWANLWEPKTSIEVAVNPRRLDEVRGWLLAACSGNSTQAFLILSGPAGSGKTTALKCLCADLSIEIVEWINPSKGAFDVSEGASHGESLLSFLQNTAKFTGGLDGVSECLKRIVLVEDLPSISNDATRTTVYSAYRHFAALYLRMSKLSRAVPAVFIVSDIAESVLDFSNLGKFSFTTARTVLPPDLLLSRYTREINFNPVATTFMRNALIRIIKLQILPHSYPRVPGPELLQYIVEKAAGDVRFAVNSLQFITRVVLADASLTKSLTVPCRSFKMTGQSRGKTLHLSQDTASNNLELLEPLVCKRTETSAFYSSLGAVLYNKRTSIPKNHIFGDFNRAVDDVEALAHNSGAPPSFFADFLFENYPRHFSDEDESLMDMISEYFSAANVLVSGLPAELTLQSLQSSLASRSILYAHSKCSRKVQQQSQPSQHHSQPFSAPTVSKNQRLSRERYDAFLDVCKGQQKTVGLAKTSFLLYDLPFQMITGSLNDSKAIELISFGNSRVRRVQPDVALSAEREADQLVASFSATDSWYELVDDIVDSESEDIF